MNLTSRQVMAFMESIRIRQNRDAKFKAALVGAEMPDIFLKKDLIKQKISPELQKAMGNRLREKIKERVAKAMKKHG